MELDEISKELLQILNESTTQYGQLRVNTRSDASNLLTKMEKQGKDDPKLREYLFAQREILSKIDSNNLIDLLKFKEKNEAVSTRLTELNKFIENYSTERGGRASAVTKAEKIASALRDIPIADRVSSKVLNSHALKLALAEHSRFKLFGSKVSGDTFKEGLRVASTFRKFKQSFEKQSVVTEQTSSVELPYKHP